MRTSGGGNCGTWKSEDAIVYSDCVLGVSLSGESINVPAGASLAVGFGGNSAPSRVGATAYPFEGNKLLGDSSDGLLFSRGGGEPSGEVVLRAHRHGTRLKLPENLPAGEYALRVHSHYPQGEALYGYHLIVE